MIKQKRACRSKQHALAGIIIDIEKIIRCIFTVGGNLKMPRDNWPNETGYEQFLLQENDIVMAMDRPWVNGGFKIARVDANHLPALLIQRTACIRGKGILQEFLHMLLDSQRFAEHCNITGSLVPHISNKDINSFQVILPPIELQNEFASFVAQVDKSKSVNDRIIDRLQRTKASLMQEYFG